MTLMIIVIINPPSITIIYFIILFELIFSELVGFSAALFSLPIRTKERHNELSVIHKIGYTVLIDLFLMFLSVCTVCRNVALA